VIAEKKQEFTRRIGQANSTELVIVIYDIALDYLEEARNAIEANNRRELTKITVNIRNCINELIGSLNYDYSPAGEMLQLYMYCSRRLIAVNNSNDMNALEEISSILKRLRDAYVQISDANTSGPVMENSQSVYAGLTYGRNTLNENVFSSPNRGFKA